MGQPIWKDGSPIAGVNIEKGSTGICFILDPDLDLAGEGDQVATPAQMSQIHSLFDEIPYDIKADDADRLIACIEFVEAFNVDIIEQDADVSMALCCACLRDAALLRSVKAWKLTGKMDSERIVAAWNALWNEVLEVMDNGPDTGTGA